MLFDVTYEIVSPDGEVEGSGFLCRKFSLRDAVEIVHATRTNRVAGVECIECGSSPVVAPRWVTVFNGMEFETGMRECRSLHIPESCTPATRRRIARMLGA